MSDLISLPNYSQAMQAFINEQASHSGIKFQPKKLKLNGEIGQFSLIENLETPVKVMKDGKEVTEYKKTTVLPATSIVGTILNVSYYAKWKYQEGATAIIRTREFETFDEPIELLKITYGDQGKTEVQKKYSSYQEFKEDQSVIDKMTGKVTSPFDFCVALYIWNHKMNEVIKYEFKGSTRTNFFDYNKSFKSDFGRDMAPRSLVQIKTIFGIRDEKNDYGKEWKSGTFTSAGFNDTDTMEKIMEASTFLRKWKKSYKKEKVVTIQAEEIPVIDVGEDPISSIPF